MSVMVLAAGNSIIKAKITQREQGEITFPHAIQQITQAEYTNILSRSKTARISSNYIRVNGQAYVVGESAERYSIIIKRSGAARYTRDYYGILAAAAFGRLYDRSREVSVFASHASGDARFREF